MKLSQQEIELFFKLWLSLIWAVNQKHQIAPAFERPVYGKYIDQEPIIAVRNQLWENPHWIDEFLSDSEYGDLTETEYGIIHGWRSNYIKGRFIIMKHYSKYSVFMTDKGPTKLYGVCGISGSIRETTLYETPLLVETVLLPFKDRIIYDSFLNTFGISFGKNIKGELKTTYNEAMEKYEIIENLDNPHARKPKAQASGPPAVKVPKVMSERYMEVAEIIEHFCNENLNDEYCEICLRALAKLCRKRPSPLVSGRARTWACGIVYAIGSNNFIFDKSQPIHMTAAEISDWFRLSKSTAGNKAAEISKLLDLSYFNTGFLLKSIADNNPAIWYFHVNGHIFDIRNMPREDQEDAFHKGLIPYIPADR